ncbi:hypothetical protein KAM329D_00590 [Aeromonas caviae]|nr:hypothetical protein KAM329_039150 [Aeromonas caviae]GJA48314.1 hypothetical protein KAM347_01050 [Aeromonas caviae]GJA57277.1 hypothetical protein KAM350_02700 [Aeromonas caviae]GJA66295.1 hypothetical protein KAM352_02710 [Aeromonas caviae]GJB94887.1 hypothetical protein KAM383_04670 [Aeromonas caviae]
MLMNWIARALLLAALLAVLVWGQEKEYGFWSLGFLLAAWVMLEPRLRPVLILLPVAGMTGVVTLLWQQGWH